MMYRRRLIGVLLVVYFFSGCTSLTVQQQTQKRIIQESVVKITDVGERRGGTGFHVKLPSGNVAILTNSHICELADSKGILYVTDELTSRAMPRRILDNSDITDLCLVEPLPGRPALEMSDTAPKHGDFVKVDGHPMLVPTVESTGELVQEMVAQVMVDYVITDEDAANCSKPKNRIIKGVFSPDICLLEINSYQISAPIFGGNSGSPLMNQAGKVVGVIFAGDGRTNWGFAVTLDQVTAFIGPY